MKSPTGEPISPLTSHRASKDERLSRQGNPVHIFSKAGAIFALILMVISCTAPAFAVEQIDDAGAVSMAPLSQDYIKYQQSASSHRSLVSAAEPEIENGSGHAMGLIPRRTDFSYLAGSDVSDALLSGKASEGIVTASHDMVGLPTSYDLRQTGKLMAIRDQSTSGSCWAFATYASLESYLMAGETRDFSENNMKNTAGFDLDPNLGGGNDYMSTAYLVRWSGPVNEATDPYDPDSISSPSYPPVKHVQDVLYLPPRAGYTNNDNIKSAIMTYGALYTTIRYDASSYDSSTHSYYYSGSGSINHAVAIVGWDDNYNKNNFTSVPSGNGAFIVRNSWNTDWGEAGYFYISYYDTKIGKDNTVFTAEPTYNYDHIYQYDWLGWVSSIGNGADTAYFASNYESTGEQVLKATGFYTAAVNSEYQIKVYRGGVLMQTTSGTIAVPGYHTVQLDSSVPLDAGQAFRIEVRLRTPGYGYPIPVEYADADYSSGAVQNASETFYSVNGVTWYDAATDMGCSICLKAYTQDSYSIVGFSQPSYTVAENAGSAVITVTRGSSSSSCTVDYQALEGNTSARDFTTVQGTLSFATGETTQTFTVPITGDQFLEESETIALLLYNPTGGAVIDDDLAPLTIIDDETVPSPLPATLAFAASETDGSLSMIDVTSNTVIAVLDAGTGAHDVAVSPGGAFVYVTDNSTGKLRIFIVRTLAFLQPITVGDRPHGIAVSPDGSTAAVANSGSNTVSLVNLSTRTVSSTVNVGQSPEAVAFSPDGLTAYAVNRAAGTVSKINTQTGSVTSTVNVGSSPQNIAVAPDGRAYITNYGSNSISVINGAQVTTINLAGQPYDIVVSPDGGLGYVSYPDLDSIDIISLPDGASQGHKSMPAPGVIGLSADGEVLYGAGIESRIFEKFTLPDGFPVFPIMAGNNTTGLAIGPAYQDPTVEFASATYSVTRSDAELTITIERDGCIDTPISLGVSATGGNATAGTDYAALPFSVEISQGAREATFNLTVLGGTTGDRTLVLTLISSPEGAQTGSTVSTTISIVEDRIESVTLDLVEGWNLISLPLRVENNDLATIFPGDVRSGIVEVWGWDVTAQEWEYYSPDPNGYYYQYYPELTNIDTGKAYWVEMNKSASFTVLGFVPDSSPNSPFTLQPDWNFVGSTGITPETPAFMYPAALEVWGWDVTAQEWEYYSPDPNGYYYQYYPELNYIESGHGYWVSMP